MSLPQHVVAGFSPRWLRRKMRIWTYIERGLKPATTYLIQYISKICVL
jgi:hypothetical protein